MIFASGLARRIGVVAAAGALVASTALAAGEATGAAADTLSDPVSLVDPLIGTSGGGNTFPGPAVPFGMLQWSPDTSPSSIGGYSYDASAIKGFSLTHLSGAGCAAAGDIPILPTAGAVGDAPQDATASFSHDAEQASPGHYRVTLDPGTAGSVTTEMTATARTGIGQFTYPAGSQANMLIKAGDSLKSPNSAARVEVVGDDEVVGSATDGHFCGQPNEYTVYFAVQFDRPFSSYGTWTGAGTSPGSRIAFDPKAGAWVSFDTAKDPAVLMKVAISYVSVDNALANLQAEDPGWSMSSVANQASRQWRSLLSRIQVGGGTPDQQLQFYTALYHALVQPSVISDANGQYLGFDNRVHTLPPGQAAQYTTFSGWDIYRSEVPLLATVVPGRTGDMVQSLLNDQAQGGWLPKWPQYAGYTGVMNGDAADPIIAEAYAFGVRNFDTSAALAAMVKGATQVPTGDQLGQGWYEERPQLADYLQRGWVPNTQNSSISATPNGASETLEYALADFSIGQFARALGDDATYQQFLARSQNWANIFNTATGYIQPRDAQGSFPAGDPVSIGMTGAGQSGFQEGNAAQYTWMVPQNLHGLFTAMGGNAAAIARLDDFFSQLNAGETAPYMDAGNEPSIGTPWEYDYAGVPYKTQDVVHRLITEAFSASPAGEPGNDDLGAMSSWLVWADLGMYPETPGAPVLALGAPVFSQVSLELPHGGSVTLSAPGASTTSYVQNLTVDGQAWSKAWIPADAITAAHSTELAYTMGPVANTSWASGPGDAPPSYPAGPLHFPAATAAFFVLSSSRLQMTPGTSTSVRLDVNNDYGRQPATVSWTSDAQRGTTTTIDPSGDTYVYSGQTGPYGQVDPTKASASTYKTLLAFPLDSLPAGATIADATVTLQSSNAATIGGGFTFNQVASGWDPDTVTWSTKPATTGPVLATSPTPPDANTPVSTDLGSIGTPGSDLDLQVGYSAAGHIVNIDGAASAGHPTLTIAYTAGDQPADLSLSPSSGTVTASAGGTTSATVQVSVPADATAGYDAVVISGTTSTGVPLQPVRLLVQVS